MRYILGHRARGNRTPAGSALFSVTPTFLPLRRLRRGRGRPHPFPVARKQSPAWRFLQCRGTDRVFVIGLTGAGRHGPECFLNSDHKADQTWLSAKTAYDELREV